MDSKILVCIMLISYSSKSYQNEAVAELPSNSGEQFENKLFDDILTREVNTTTKKPLSNYEVTELVNDIPDDRTVRPIVTNFTPKTPLNLAPNVPNVQDKDGNSEETNDEGKKNYINIFHIKAEYDDKKDGNKVEDSKVTANSIKEYFNGIKKGIVNGFNSIIHKHKHKDDEEDFDLHDIETGPVLFFKKLHKTSSDVAHKVQHALFGHKFDDVFDER